MMGGWFLVEGAEDAEGVILGELDRFY